MSPSARRAAVDRGAWPYKMKDLCELTGVPRQVVHFYIQQGLVPEGHKTGRNMAYYGEQHVERVRLVRQLQHERFLPLKAIRALLEEREEAFSPAQRRLLHEVKQRLAPALAGRAAARDAVAAAPLLARAGIAPEELRELAEMGLLGVSEDAAGGALIAREDAWMLELWGEVRAAGFTRELGFSPADLAVFEQAIDGMFRHEAALLTARLAQLPPEQVAAMVERALPLINSFLARYHATKVRNFFAAM